MLLQQHGLYQEAVLDMEFVKISQPISGSVQVTSELIYKSCNNLPLKQHEQESKQNGHLLKYVFEHKGPQE